jgi:hypothetical protein
VDQCGRVERERMRRFFISVLGGAVIAAAIAAAGFVAYLYATHQAVNFRSEFDTAVNGRRCDYWYPGLRGSADMHAYVFGDRPCRMLIPVNAP